MLSNAYFLAKFRFDTAENEPAKNLQNFANFADANPLTLTLACPLKPRWRGGAAGTSFCGALAAGSSRDDGAVLWADETCA